MWASDLCFGSAAKELGANKPLLPLFEKPAESLLLRT
jgi:hypothetical protein